MENLFFSNFVWIIPLALVAIGYFGIAATGFFIVNMMRNAKESLKPIILNPDSQVMSHIREQYPWAEANGFEWVNSYQSVGSAVVAAWKKKGEPTIFCVYCLSNGKISRDFCTDLKEGALTTGSSPDAGLFPHAPGDYAQTFPNCTIEEQWNWHIHALEYLTKNHGSKVAEDKKSFEESFREGLKTSVEHVVSIPFWPLRVPYWFFVRRKRVLGKTVSELLHQGFLLNP